MAKGGRLPFGAASLRRLFLAGLLALAAAGPSAPAAAGDGALALLADPPPAGLPAGLAAWHRLAPALVGRAGEALDAPDAALLSRVALELDPRLIPGAYAIRDPEGAGRSIVIYAGMAAGIDTTIRLQVAGHEAADCRRRHSDGFYRRFFAEVGAADETGALGSLPSAEQLLAGDPACREAANRLAIPSAALAARYETLVEGALAFLLLHELGHHALGHEAPASPAASRAQELAADDWALARLPRLVDPLDAFPALLFIARINWFRPETEAAMSHPHGRQRLLRLVETILATTDDPGRTRVFGSLHARLAGLDSEAEVASAASADPRRADR